MKSALASLTLFASVVVAQSLPPPGRTVYRCEEGGKVSYSDSPCLGAQKLEIEPTRGLNQSSGRQQIGKDVRRERNQEQLAEAIRPLTGMTVEQLDLFGRRQRLAPATQQSCKRLDGLIPKAEAAENAASAGSARDAAQRRLLALRTDYRQLNCD